jgi:hypothetical protein
MDVGSKFDAWIAEHVMKWQIVQIYSSENIIAFQADDGKRKYTGVDLAIHGNGVQRLILQMHGR